MSSSWRWGVLAAAGVVAGCTVEEDLACGGSRDTYPAGPYGASERKIIENHAFTAADGSAFSFASVLADPDAKLILLTTAAGWCTACIEKQEYLQQLHEDNYERGLRVVLAYFQDESFRPAKLEDGQAWVTRFGLTFPVVIDPDFVLGQYYDSALTPMNMIIELPCMKILELGTGTDFGAIEGILAARLAD